MACTIHTIVRTGKMRADGISSAKKARGVKFYYGTSSYTHWYIHKTDTIVRRDPNFPFPRDSHTIWTEPWPNTLGTVTRVRASIWIFYLVMDEPDFHNSTAIVTTIFSTSSHFLKQNKGGKHLHKITIDINEVTYYSQRPKVSNNRSNWDKESKLSPEEARVSQKIHFANC